MKMKKISYVFLLVLLISTFISSSVFAAVSDDKKIPQESVILADVNIREARIISTEGNTFKISFSVSNGQGLQTGVKYGVSLVSSSTQKPIIMDEKVYEESLSLPENSTIKKEITYIAPGVLDGKYKIYVTSKNESGFPFGAGLAGEVTLVNVIGSIKISPDTCTMGISGGQINTQYKFGYTFGLLPEENIKLSCSASNLSDKEIEVIPVFSTKEGTAYGKEVQVSESKVDAIKFKAKETKTFSFFVPKSQTPSMYYVSVGLKSGDFASNNVNFSYIVKGTIATIDNLFIDKDYYKRGDNANLSFVWTYVAGDEFAAKDGVSVTAQITGENGKSCTKLYSQKLVKDSSLKNEIVLPITKSCFNPKVLLTMKDKSGNILDEKIFKMDTTSTKAPSSNALYYIILILILIIFAFFVYIKSKKNNLSDTDNTSPKVPISIIFLFVVMAAFSLLVPSKSANAQTFSFPAGSTAYSVPCSAYATAELDSTSYYTSSTISASGTISENTCGSYVGMTGSNSANALGNSIIAPGNYYSSAGSSTYYTNSWGGTGSISFTAYANGYSGSTSIGYSVSVASVPADPTVTVSATKTSIGETESTTVSWSSVNATSCSCSRSSNGASCGSGAGQNITGSTYLGSEIKPSETFTVTCSN